ncbi:hypothetical protein B0H13DRAFT_2357661 [Mycena leptocephala]|nr:hypothetical protein B0H13DRAFT_2357661 [Mycena leptocephala]
MQTLRPTNMNVREMIPDIFNPRHDPAFWCVPPTHDAPSENHGGGYPMYLVTQGRQVGIWHNWTVAKTMVEGYPQSAFRGHHTVEGCTREWQIHCGLGVHPHPVDPSLQSPPPGTQTPARARARPVDPELQALLQAHCMPVLPGTATLVGCDRDSLSTASTGSSITVTTWVEVPAATRYLALWKGRVVYSDRLEAKAAFMLAERDGAAPSILATTDYDEAQAFSVGIYWIED